MTDVLPSSAVPLQPVKEAGQGVAPQANQQSSSSSDSDVEELDSNVRGGRGAKRSRRDDAAQSLSTLASLLMAPVSVSSDPSLAASGAVAVTSTAAAAGATTAAASAAPGGANRHQNWVPLYVSHEKLRDASVDDHRRDAVVVSFETDARLPSPLLVNPSQYSGHPAAKLRAAVSLLDSPNGFGLVPPVIPSMLLSASTMASVAGTLTNAQRQWLDTLQRYTNDYYALVTQQAYKSDAKAVTAVLQDVLVHLNALQDTACPLWPKDSLTKGWAELLTAPSRIVQAPSSDQSAGRAGGRSTSSFRYTVELHTPKCGDCLRRCMCDRHVRTADVSGSCRHQRSCGHLAEGISRWRCKLYGLVG